MQRIEWLEVPTFQKQKAKEEYLVVKAKTCPRCGWLEPEYSVECFRCGYRFDLSPVQDFFKSLNIALPAPQINFKLPGRRELSKRFLMDERAYRFQLQFEKVSLIRGFENLLGLETSNIERYPYQIETTKKVLQRMGARALLADEVGLGKTIEAGMILKELVIRGLVKSTLILVPAFLVGQWKNEMESKFGLKFTIADRFTNWENENFIISSMDLARRDEHATRIVSREWDMLIVDEAHKLKNRYTKLHKFVNRIKKKYVLFLTATPLHNDLLELYGLVNVLQPGLFGTVRRFKRQFVSPFDKRTPKNLPQLKKLLSEVMVRNTRDRVAVSLPPRKVAIYHLELTPAERALYKEITDYVRTEYRKNRDNTARQLSLITLQKEITSSVHALKKTLLYLANSEEHPPDVREKMAYFLEKAIRVKDSAKLEAVQDILSTFKEKTIIYTSFVGTLEFLYESLKDMGYKVSVIHGGMNWRERDESIEYFRTDGDILVSTDSGGEGYNFQFCRMVINFDLPWNPMKIEQRIGRVHRLGQKKEVIVFNLSTKETVEEHIIEILAKKIRMFELVIGELDLILGEMGSSFEKTIAEIVAGSRDDEEMRRRFEEFGEKLQLVRKRYKEIKRANEFLDGIE